MKTLRELINIIESADRDSYQPGYIPGARDHEYDDDSYQPGYIPGVRDPEDGSDLEPGMPGVTKSFFGIDDKIKAKIQDIVVKISDMPGMWDHQAQTFTDQGMAKLKARLKDNPKYIKYAVSLTADDYEAESVAEGSAEYYTYKVKFEDGGIATVSVPLDKIFQGDNSAEKLIKQKYARQGRKVVRIEMLFPKAEDPRQGIQEGRQYKNKSEWIAEIKRLAPGVEFVRDDRGITAVQGPGKKIAGEWTDDFGSGTIYHDNIQTHKKSGEQGVAEGYTPSAGELARDQIKLSDADFQKKYGMSKVKAKQHYSSSRLKEQGVAEGNTGQISVNMKQMDRWKVAQDNVKYYDAIMKNKGKIQSLDVRPYIELLNDFGIFYTAKEQGVQEAGPFSYGAKKPRRGSVADLADKKRREQEKGKQPIEPRDQRVGTAKVTKDVAEGGEGGFDIEDMVMDQYRNGKNLWEIAQDLGISEDEVEHIIDSNDKYVYYSDRYPRDDDGQDEPDAALEETQQVEEDPVARVERLARELQNR